jgi:DNA-binding NarL/FixJ family response regulator
MRHRHDGRFLLAGMHPRDLSVTVDRMTLRCVIVDDSSVFVVTARKLLEQQGLTVLGVAGNGAEALRLTADLNPDVLLVDIDLDGESGLDVVRHLAGAADPAPRMILISTHAEEVYADLVAQSPAVGFLPKAKLSATAVQRLLEGRRDSSG